MNRKHSTADYRRIIHSIRNILPEATVFTDIIVGFKGETDEEFYDSVRLIEDLDIDYIEVLLFQPRPGTKAYNMKEQVPVKIAKKREHIMYRKIIRKHIYKKLLS